MKQKSITNPGNYFRNAVVISRREAWRRVFTSEEFQDDVYTCEDLREIQYEQAFNICANEWRKEGLSSIKGFRLRGDGKVEVNLA